MFEGIAGTVSQILSLTIGGISLGGIIAFGIAFIKYVVKERKRRLKEKNQQELTTETIKECFKDVVLPKSLKLDVRNKIEQPIKEGLLQIQEAINERLVITQDELKLILTILSQLTHVKKLPEETQEQIAAIVEKGDEVEVKL